ncbi:MAG TPA: dihydrodipicolinate synthase family protein, partial [Planctomycetota bacterium]|nr:dihydrodipicolinate synthase family protein [Planctomycetota bacterium]
MSLRGVIPPLVTPFHADGGLDLEAFSGSLEALAAHDFAGFLALGSTGEASSLDEDEKLLLVAAARRTVPGRFLLVGSGLESTRATVAFTRKVIDLGADAVLVLTPCYYKNRMTVEALRRHFEAVADASSVPVYLYSVPAFTGLPWPADVTPALAAHPRIRGIKESSGDINLFARITASVPNGFEVACGNAAVIYPAL